jgi:hypothetical protein
MRVYAICRQCAEVHLATAGCPGCARAAAIGRRDGTAGTALGRDGSGDALGPHRGSTGRSGIRLSAGCSPGGPRGETTALVEHAPRRRRVWLSAAVLGAYLLAILGLLAAVLLGQATAI